jgi:aspartate racemase
MTTGGRPTAREPKMKTVGLIGGVGPESTIEYYRFIIEAYRKRKQDDTYPSIIINSVDVNKYVALATANQFDTFADNLVVEIERLARAGADFGALAANTPHIVFDELQRRSRIPLVSIVEATCDEAHDLGIKRVALLGTRFTMTGGFYQDVFGRAGIDLIVPNEKEQNYIHEKYIGELLKNIFADDTRAGLLAIIDQLRERDAIEAVILGGTELPLILRDAERAGMKFLDTTKIHVEKIVERLLS